jgi:hypothetical protein
VTNYLLRLVTSLFNDNVSTTQILLHWLRREAEYAGFMKIFGRKWSWHTWSMVLRDRGKPWNTSLAQSPAETSLGSWQCSLNSEPQLATCLLQLFCLQSGGTVKPRNHMYRTWCLIKIWRYLATDSAQIHFPHDELTETCERQVGNNTGPWTVQPVIRRSWCCGGGSTGCGRRLGPWPRSWWGDSRSYPTAVVTTSVITTHRASLAVGRVGYQNRWTLAECSHDVDETEARTTRWRGLWWCAGLARDVQTQSD